MTPESFIARWQHADGSELANAQSFTRELCELLHLPFPDPRSHRIRLTDLRSAPVRPLANRALFLPGPLGDADYSD
jgi:hypothetical protein